MKPTKSAVSSALVATLCLLGSGETASATDWWYRPLPGEIVQQFRPPERTHGPGHRGVDIATSPGASVVAMHSGTVLFAGEIAGIPIISLSTNSGELRSTYQPVTTLVNAGDQIEQGAVLGLVSDVRIDHCSQSCLHVGVRTDTQYFDPRIFWGGSVVLKPR